MILLIPQLIIVYRNIGCNLILALILWTSLYQLIYIYMSTFSPILFIVGIRRCLKFKKSKMSWCLRFYIDIGKSWGKVNVQILLKSKLIMLNVAWKGDIFKCTVALSLLSHKYVSDIRSHINPFGHFCLHFQVAYSKLMFPLVLVSET